MDERDFARFEFKMHFGGILHNSSNYYFILHYGDVIMGAIVSQITSLTIVYSTVYSEADQTKHQSSASLAFVRGIHRGPVNSPHKWPVTRKMFPCDDVIMATSPSSSLLSFCCLYALTYIAPVRFYVSFKDTFSNICWDRSYNTKGYIRFRNTIKWVIGCTWYFILLLLYLVPPDAECLETWDHIEDRYIGAGARKLIYIFGVPSACKQACVDDSLCRSLTYHRIDTK